MKSTLLEAVRSTVKFWWVSLLVGILALIVGIWSLTDPLTTLGALTIFFVASLFVSGVFDITFAISNRKILDGWGWTLTLGIISVIFSIVLLSRPIESLLVLVALAGFWVMFTSVASITGAVEMQRLGFRDWGWLLAFGILGVILSFLMIINPAFTSSMIVAIFAASMIFYGFVRIFYSFKLRKINKYIKEAQGKK